jgi:uncharacterized membrane protein
LKLANLAINSTVLLFGLITIASVKAEDDATFALRVCNASGVEDISLAVLSPLDTQDEWRLEGWWPVPDTGCKFINRFRGPVFYTYAMSADYYWGADDAHQCVNLRRRFDRTIGPQRYICAPTEVSVGFKRRVVESGSETYEITLR